MYTAYELSDCSIGCPRVALGTGLMSDHHFIPARKNLTETTAEVHGQERVQQRIKRAVHVVRDECDRSEQNLPEREGELLGMEGLPHDTDVIR